MSNQLYTLSFFSRHANDNRDPMELAREIQDILTVARRSNAQSGITGAMLYNAGRFAQVLEGPLSEVEKTFDRIMLDRRHRDVTMLQFHPIDRRNFGNWSMAFAGIGPEAPHHAKTSLALADPGEIIAGQEGSDLIALLRDLIGRQELHEG
jgi:hypothetical protein